MKTISQIKEEIRSNPFKQKLFILLAPLLGLELALILSSLLFGIDSIPLFAILLMSIDFPICLAIIIHLYSSNQGELSSNDWMQVSNYSNLNSISKNINDLNKRN